MSGQFFDRDPNNWQDLEDLVLQAFIEMGYESNRSFKLHTVRSTVEIDVHAIKTSTPIPTIVLCECKYWDQPVSQSMIHAFRSVCSDSGAHFGLMISKKGFQAGAEASRSATNIHLMNFTEFQNTYFDEWRKGAFMMLTKMRDQLLPILRASALFQESGLDLIRKSDIEGVDVFNKYSVIFGGYSKFFIEHGTFPTTINDPRGDPRQITQVCVASHREYLEIVREAVVENTKRFGLPAIYFSDIGEMIVTVDSNQT